MEVDEYVKLVFTKRNVNGKIAAFFQTEPRNHCSPHSLGQVITCFCFLSPRENAEMSDFFSGKYTKHKGTTSVFSEGNRYVIYSPFSLNPSCCYASAI